jgi:hypothetical protein
MSLGPPRLPRPLALAVLVTILGIAAIGAAGPVAAQPAATPNAARVLPVCTRAHNQWARLVTANKRASIAFNRAQSLQNQLLRQGRTTLAHRLDTRLAYLRQAHTLLVSRVQAIATRVQGRCTERPPDLTSF